MVITTRIVVGAISIVCLMQGLAGGNYLLPPPGASSTDIVEHVSAAVEKLQSHVDNTIDRLREKLISGDVMNNGVPIKDAYLELQTERENFEKMSSALDPKYANCSREQMEAVKLAFSVAEVRIPGGCGLAQRTPLVTAILEVLSFNSTDKSLIFVPCLPTSSLPTDEELSQAEGCVDAALAKAVQDLDAAAIFDRANTKGKEDATSCVGTYRDTVKEGVRELGEDLTRCIAETDGNTSSVAMTRRLWCYVRCNYVYGIRVCFRYCRNMG